MDSSRYGLWSLSIRTRRSSKGTWYTGPGTMAIHPDGTLCIDGSEVQLTDEWGRPFYLRLKMRVYEGIDEVVERDSHLIGAFAGAGSYDSQ